MSEGRNDHLGGSRTEVAIEIILKVYDPVPEFEGVVTEQQKIEHLKTDSGIRCAPVDEASAECSPAKLEVHPKSHTVTLGRVIRRDELVDFIEPLLRNLEGVGKKIPDPHQRSDPHFRTRESLAELPAAPPGASQ